MQRRDDLREALLRALAAIKVSKADVSGRADETYSKFIQLEQTLNAALRDIELGQQVNHQTLRGLVKWVGDWIPDVDDPLLARLDQVEDSLTR
jgi:hypothetical protein